MTSLHGWLRLVWKMSDFGDLSQSCVRFFESCIRHFEALSLKWSVLKWRMHLSYLVRFGFLGFGFEQWVCSKSSLRLIFSKLFVINKIISSSGPRILDFGRYMQNGVSTMRIFISILSLIRNRNRPDSCDNYMGWNLIIANWTNN